MAKKNKNTAKSFDKTVYLASLQSRKRRKRKYYRKSCPFGSNSHGLCDYLDNYCSMVR